jgi:hypothetical protein
VEVFGEDGEEEGCCLKWGCSERNEGGREKDGEGERQKIGEGSVSTGEEEEREKKGKKKERRKGRRNLL